VSSALSAVKKIRSNPKEDRSVIQLRFSFGLTVRRWFGISEFFLPRPSNIDCSKVKDFTILPKNGAFYLEMSYEVECQQHDLDRSQALSIDLGTLECHFKSSSLILGSIALSNKSANKLPTINIAEPIIKVAMTKYKS